MEERIFSIRTYAPSIRIDVVGLDEENKIFRLPVIAIKETIFVNDNYNDEEKLFPGFTDLTYMTCNYCGEVEEVGNYEEWIVGYEFYGVKETWDSIVAEMVSKIKKKEEEKSKGESK